MFGLLVFVVGGVAGAVFLFMVSVAKLFFLTLGAVLLFTFALALYESRG